MEERKDKDDDGGEREGERGNEEYMGMKNEDMECIM